MVDTMEALLGGPVYHFQSKLTAKEPFVGGAWEWHQDYGYWYHNGCLFPHLASYQIALDRSNSANGCLQMVQGSATARPHRPRPRPRRGPERRRSGPHEAHHAAPGDRAVRAGTRRRRVLPQQHVASLFFHSNTLHRSDQNLSPHRRWTLICCYNRIDNDNVVRDHDRYYVPLDKVPDSAVKAAGLRFAGGDEHFTSRPFVPKVA
ncbi:MAG TPA: phytanoyl-CoA dioxygenase family protein [Acetobacteraceae bacterium]|nr:phytanoyl-CoA dioxygenase family protein [Acetobacteraceae bacterium]